MTTKEYLGTLKKFTIWIDNKGNSPDWMVSKVVIVDLKTDEKYVKVYKQLQISENNNSKVLHHEMKKIFHPKLIHVFRIQLIECFRIITKTYKILQSLFYIYISKTKTVLTSFKCVCVTYKGCICNFSWGKHQCHCSLIVLYKNTVFGIFKIRSVTCNISQLLGGGG